MENDPIEEARNGAAQDDAGKDERSERHSHSTRFTPRLVPHTADPVSSVVWADRRGSRRGTHITRLRLAPIEARRRQRQPGLGTWSDGRGLQTQTPPIKSLDARM